MLQSEELPGNVTIKSAARECYDQKDSVSATIKQTVRECRYKKDDQGVLQSKGLQGMSL